MPSQNRRVDVHLPTPHQRQAEFIASGVPRKCVRAGRRGGKTVGVSVLAVEQFLAGKRILYGAPTTEQVDRFWTTVTRALAEPIARKVFYKNETEHVIERLGTEQRIRAKTCWNSNTLRGDYADVLILDEWQLMDEAAWDEVGAPMLLDNNGDAIFIYTPPSLHSRSVSKARDPQHAAKMFKRAQGDTSGRWQTFHFTSRENPHISTAALDEIAHDMTAVAYRMEIMAEDVDEAPGALWKREHLDSGRVLQAPELKRVFVGVDPSGSVGGDATGIVTVGGVGNQLFVLADDTLNGTPLEWAKAAVTAYYRHGANGIVAEANFGGDMVLQTIRTVDANVPVKLVTASRSKQVRAEPVAAVFEQQRGHLVGTFPALEDELVLWTPGDASPNRLDAMVWAATDLLSRRHYDKPGAVGY
jgi:hypothetical protein